MNEMKKSFRQFHQLFTIFESDDLSNGVQPLRKTNYDCSSVANLILKSNLSFCSMSFVCWI